MMLYLGPDVFSKGSGPPGGLAVVHVTLHVALKDVFAQLSEDAVVSKAWLADQFMVRLTGRRPRIGVCALNPHGGEGGLFGREEIDEILGKYEKFPLREPLWRRIRRNISRRARGAGQWLTSRLPRITVGRVMAAGVILILAALFGPSLFNLDSDAITRGIILAGLALFIGAFIFSLRRRPPYVEQRWRGRSVDVQQPGVGSRLRSWWDRWRSRRR